jgi:uncharacterized LabA/DUF88 family protein
MKKSENNFAFIDSQNLNLSIQYMGWKLDFNRFRIYLQDKLNVNKAYLFIGYVPANQRLYTALQEDGYVLVFKPTVEYRQGKVKGNVDAELVLHAMIQYPNYNGAVIITGDGDFTCLVDYLQSKRKLKKLVVPNRKKYSSLLRKYNKQILFLNGLKNKLERKKRH